MKEGEGQEVRGNERKIEVKKVDEEESILSSLTPFFIHSFPPHLLSGERDGKNGWTKHDEHFNTCDILSPHLWFDIFSLWLKGMHKA